MLEYVVLFALLLGACYWILNPLLQEDIRQNGFTPKAEDTLNDLKHKKDGAYAVIKELEFDLSMGKLTEEDFQTLRQQYTQEAIGYMSAIDKLELPPAAFSKPVDTVEEENGQAHTESHNHQPAGRKDIYCTSCGRKTAVESRFCAACGSNLYKHQDKNFQEEN